MVEHACKFKSIGFNSNSQYTTSWDTFVRVEFIRECGADSDLNSDSKSQIQGEIGWIRNPQFESTDRLQYPMGNMENQAEWNRV